MIQRYFAEHRTGRKITAILLGLVVLTSIFSLPPSIHAASFTVNSTLDTSDASPGNGVCQTAVPGQCTLRAAIEETNALAGADTINFGITGGCPVGCTISAGSQYPEITETLTIDGFSQAGSSVNTTTTPKDEGLDTVLRITVTGVAAINTGLFEIQAGSDLVTMRGLNIAGVAGASGIAIVVNGNADIDGNFIGTNLSGTSANPNTGIAGIAVNGGNVRIGFNEPNLISGNLFAGILEQVSGADVTISNNLIGTDITGTSIVANGTNGIEIDSTVNDVLTTISENLISGNTDDGVFTAQDRNPSDVGVTLTGNYIGVAAGGGSALGNTGNGINIASANAFNTIGGTLPGEGNLISGNSLDGILVESNFNTIQGNFIGTNVLGTFNIPNGENGVTLNFANATVIGSSSATGCADGCNLISGNTGDGIFITGSIIQNEIQGNYVGVNLAGTAALGNGGNGITLANGSNDFEIGAGGSGVRNVISGNTGSGILIEDSTTTDITLARNYIGLNSAGTAAIPNGIDGVTIQTGANGISIGEATSGRNVISGNGINGISISETDDISIVNNYIGTNAAASAGIASDVGVQVTDSTAITIGGSLVSERNVISGNGRGIEFNSVTSSTIKNNYIGTNPAGTAVIFNSSGIYLSSSCNNVIGGVVAGDGNLISGNFGVGITLVTGSCENAIDGNKIGTDVTGTLDLGNGDEGIVIYDNSDQNIIGGGAPNIIAFNAENGIRIATAGFPTSTNNKITRNSIHDNVGLGIDLEINGVTANDTNDPDAGANSVQNFPVITLAEANEVRGTLNSNTDDTYEIELFTADTDATNHGEGETFIASTTCTVPVGGNNCSWVITGLSLLAGSEVTTTATDSDNNTSEFSSNEVVGVGPLDHFDVTGISNPSTVGVPEDVMVTARDVANNIKTNYTGTITFSSTDPDATLPANYTFVVGDGGDRTFLNGVIFGTAGIQTVTVNDLSDPTKQGSQTVTVNPAPPTKIVFTTPERTTDTATISGLITIETQDANNNPSDVTADTTVTLTSTSGTGTFKASGAANCAAATITDVTILTGAQSASFRYCDTTVGDFTITANDTAPNTLTSATQAIHIVCAGCITQLTITSAPFSIDQNELSPVITVETQDINNLPANVGADTTIALDTTSSGGTFKASGAVTCAAATITSVVITNGTSSAGFKYCDSSYGTPTISVSESPSEGWQDDTQLETINDVIEPNSTITTPSLVAYRNDNIFTELRGTATDNSGGSGVDVVEVSIRRSSDSLYWDGTGWTSVPEDFLSTSYALGEWSKLSGLPTWEENIEYTIRSRATDIAGNVESTPDSASFMLDNTPPETFSLISPAHNSYTADSTPSLSWEASADGQSGLAKYQLYVDGSLKVNNIGTACDPCSASVPDALAEGSHTWFVRAVDVAGNIRNSNQTFTFIIDITAPNLSILTPSTTYTNNFSAVEGVSSDLGSGVDFVKVSIRDNTTLLYFDGSAFTSVVELFLTASGRTNWSLTVSGLVSGHSYTVRAFATDKVGRQSSIDSRTTFFDNTAPTASVLNSPADGTITFNKIISFTWEAATDFGSGIDHYELWIDGKKVGETTGTSLSVSVSTGSHTWYVIAVDRAGNRTQSEKRSFIRAIPIVISNLRVENIGLTSADVIFDTNIPTTAVLTYVCGDISGTLSSNNETTHHVFHITNIPPNTTCKVTVTASKYVDSTATIEFTTKSATTGPVGGPVGGIIDNIIGAIVRIIRATPPPLAYSFPYLLFLLILILVWRLLTQTKREVTRIERVKGILGREKVVAEEKDSFLSLAAHYLRTPAAILSAGTDLIGRSGAVAASVITELKTVTESLRKKVSGTIESISNNQFLSEITVPDIREETVKAYRSPYFWAPILAVAALAGVANLLFVKVGNIDIKVLNFYTQGVAFIIIAVIFFQTLRRSRVEKQNRENFDKLLNHQVTVDAARNEFIRRTKNDLSEEVARLRLILSQTPPEQSKFLNEGESRLSSILQKFQLLSEIESGKLSAKLVEFNVAPQILGAISDESVRITLKKLTVKTSGADFLLRQDKDRFIFIVKAVLDNAIKFSHEGGVIEVEYGKEGMKAFVTIRDHGIGISEEGKQHLFKPFARGTSTEQFTYEGIGFSLYLAKIVANYMGGDVVLTSELGKGTNVTITAGTEEDVK